MNILNLPEELKNIPNWVGWKWAPRRNKQGEPVLDKDGNSVLTKPPYDLKSNGTLRHAKTDDQTTWTDFKTAIAVADDCLEMEPRFDGIGFVLPPGMGGLDFDGVIVNEQTEPYVLEILKHLGNPYTEISPSGDGLRAFINTPTLPINKGCHFKGKKDGVDKYGAEFYIGGQTNKYLTVTGAPFSGSGISTPTDINFVHFLISQFGDEKFKALWMGDWQKTKNSRGEVFGSHSEADLALCTLLVRGGFDSVEKLDAAFRRSGLMRDEWNRKSTYTIAKALAGRDSKQPDYTKTGENKPHEHPILQAARKSAEQFNMDSIVFDPTLKHPEQRDYIFQGFLLVGDSALIIGAMKAEKSLFGLRWAMHASCGKSWCGFAATHPRRVAYLDGENDSADVHERYVSIVGEFTHAEQELIQQNLDIIEGRSFADAGGTLDYLNDQWWDAYAKQTATCELHFLDCLYLFHDKEPYDNLGLREVLQVLRYRIHSMGPNRTAVILHHSRSMSNDDLRGADELSLEHLGAYNFSEKSFGGKVLLKDATLVICLDRHITKDEDDEIVAQQIHFQFYGRRVPQSPLLKFEDVDGKYRRRLLHTLSKGARQSVLDLRQHRGDEGEWNSRHDAAQDLSCARGNAYRHLDEMIAKEYLVSVDGRLRLHLTADLITELSRVDEHKNALVAAVKWIQHYVVHPMKAESVIEVGDEEGHDRDVLIEARGIAGLMEEAVTDATNNSILMWRPKKKRGGFRKGSLVSQQANSKRWAQEHEQHELLATMEDNSEPDGLSDVEVV